MLLEKVTQENNDLNNKFNSFQNFMNEAIEKLNKRRVPQTCSEIYQADPTMKSGIYTIFPDNRYVVKVYCDVFNQNGESHLFTTIQN